MLIPGSTIREQGHSITGLIICPTDKTKRRGEGEKRRGEEGREGKGRERKGKGGEGIMLPHTHFQERFNPGSNHFITALEITPLTSSFPELKAGRS